jgi:hypothetical protein
VDFYSLEFDLHTLILKDLAANVGQAKDPSVLDAGLNLLGSRVEIRAPQEQQTLMNGTTEQERVFMVSHAISWSAQITTLNRCSRLPECTAILLLQSLLRICQVGM